MDQHTYHLKGEKPAPEDEKVTTVPVVPTPDAPAEPPRQGNANDPDQSEEAWRQAADNDKEPHLFGKSMVRQQQSANANFSFSPTAHF